MRGTMFFTNPRCSLLAILLLTGCVNLPKDEFTHYGDGPPKNPPDLSKIVDPIPKIEPLAKTGNRSYRVNGVDYHVLSTADNYEAVGHASWYGTKFHGRRTSSGETYDIYKMTAAHKSLPLPTYVEVTNLDNKKRVIVRVNDRGPFIDNREIDLSYAAAYRLGILKTGTAPVRIRALTPEENKPPETAQLNESHNSSQYLQVGVFSDVQNAQALQLKLKSLMNLPIVIASEPDTNTGHKVIVGPFDNEALLHRINGLLEFHGIIGFPTRLN